MSFHLDTLREALVGASLAALDRHRPALEQIALALPDEEGALLPRALITDRGGAASIPLDVAGEGGVPGHLAHLPPLPDLTELAERCRLNPDDVAFDGGIAGDLVLITLVDAAEAIAAGAQALGLTARLLPAGYLEPGEPDLLDEDAREVLWEDLRERLHHTGRPCWVRLSEYFFREAAAREQFLSRLE